MLRPKNLFSAEDLQRLASEPTSMKLSTTVLTVNKLPNYCTDRLYMLSELQVHSNSIDFLCDLNTNSSIDSLNSADNTVSTEVEEEDNNVQAVILPPSIILYLLWKPNTYPTPQSFVDGPLSECVKQCLLANGDEVLENSSSYDVSPKTPPYNSRSAPNSPTRRQHQLGVGAVSFDKLKRDTLQDEWGNSADISRSRRASIEETSNQKQMTKIYVVVDRISPSETTTDTDAVDDGIGELPDFSIGSSSFDQTDYSTSTELPPNHSQSQQHTSNETSQHNTEIKMAEKLAKSVSSNKFLRGSIDGISIGITSDARAAPGLEACMDAVCRGSKERRKAVRDYRLVGKKKKCSGISSSSSSSREEQALQRLRDKSPERSPVAIVAIQPDDLECTDNDHHHSHSHHHHSEEEVSPNILQCRVSTEWNGLGECNTFTDRAMQDWRKAWNVSETLLDENGINGMSSGNNTRRAVRPKVPRINRRKEIDNDYDDENKYADEPISTVMITVLLVGIVAYVWNLYGHIIMSVLFGDDGGRTL